MPTEARSGAKRDPLRRIAELIAFDRLLCERVGFAVHTPGRADASGYASLFEAGTSNVEARGRRHPANLRVVGFDEAGRGALAGPVIVGCVHFPRFDDPPIRADLMEALGMLDDSKRVTKRRRELLFERIGACARRAIGSASAAEIDRFGIVTATARAADRAYAAVGLSADLCLCDRGIYTAGVRSCLVTSLDEAGVSPATARTLSSSQNSKNKDLTPRMHISVTRGDGRSLHIAAASIVAKVSRDRLMGELAARFPDYELERHKGYGTARHRAAIERLGPSRIHRRSFLQGISSAEAQTR